jgi:hypothetical protein
MKGFKARATNPTNGRECAKSHSRDRSYFTLVLRGRADLVWVPINTQLQLGVGEPGAQPATPDTSLK